MSQTPGVVALVGKAGTGKSYRAFMVAHELGIDTIIDDGLMIHGSRIVAGKSAKREETGLAAIRRAIFSEPSHAEEVREALRRLDVKRVLVLATSAEMAHRITQALGLPAPERVLAIEEVSSPEDIKKALRIRHEDGKHVIPAPTFEVKRSFSGYLVDPIRLLLRPRSPGDHRVMVEKSVVRPTFSSLGKFYIADTVIAALSAHAADQVSGVARVLKVAVEKVPDGIVLKVDVAVLAGEQIRGVLEGVQRAVRETVENCTALNVISVDVTAKKLMLRKPTPKPDAQGVPGDERRLKRVLQKPGAPMSPVR